MIPIEIVHIFTNNCSTTFNINQIVLERKFTNTQKLTKFDKISHSIKPHLSTCNLYLKIHRQIDVQVTNFFWGLKKDRPTIHIDREKLLLPRYKICMGVRDSEAHITNKALLRN